MFLWVANFQGLTAGFARLATLSRTLIVGYICLINNKIWVFHSGGIYFILLHLNTRDLLLLLLLFSCYTTVSLNFGRCPISELITHSPRMMNIDYHAHTPDLTQCPRAYEMQIYHFMSYHVTCIMRATCNIINTWLIIFSTYNSHPSKEHIST